MTDRLTFEGLSVAQAVAIGDGLLAAGSGQMAKGVYAWALGRESRPAERYRLRIRIGLAANANRRTPLLMRLLQTLEAEHPTTPIFLSTGMATWLKTVPFLDDERFMALEQKHAQLLPIANWHWNLQIVVWAVQRSRDVPGDLVELGVFKGHTTLFTAEYLEFADWPKRWLLFDTFEGIPEDQVDPNWGDVNREAYTGAYSYDEVVQRFQPFGNIEVVQGRVPEILAERAPEKISFLHIDLNNTTAEIGALDALFDRLSPGAVLVLDDYCWITANAQFEAERRWFRDRGLEVLPLPTGQGLFIKS